MVYISLMVSLPPKTMKRSMRGLSTFYFITTTKLRLVPWSLSYGHYEHIRNFAITFYYIPTISLHLEFSTNLLLLFYKDRNWSEHKVFSKLLLLSANHTIWILTTTGEERDPSTCKPLQFYYTSTTKEQSFYKDRNGSEHKV